MPVPIKDEEFPRYFKQQNKLLAFISKDKMYKIEPIGSNKNPGVTIDHYITRNMVRKHWPTHESTEVSKADFKRLLENIFEAYIERIID